MCVCVLSCFSRAWLLAVLHVCVCVCWVKLLQSCLTLCNPMDCSQPGSSSVHGILQGKNNWVGCRALLQGIFPTQGSNLHLLDCRWILYCWAISKALSTTYLILPLEICDTLNWIFPFLGKIIFIFKWKVLKIWRTIPFLMMKQTFPLNTTPIYS